MKKNIVYKWWFKIIILLSMFLPIITETEYNPQNTNILIGEILQHPYINNIGVGLIIAKVFLAIIFILPFIIKENSQKIILWYYIIILFITGLFQNMSKTEYGFSFIIGNMLAQSIVAIFCACDLFKNKSKISKENLNKRALWIIPLMLLALFMPYIVKDNAVTPSINSIVNNEAGVTYCMITPIMIGICILFKKEIFKPTLHIISFVGFIFGVFNMMTWFGINPQNWWMGILHLPLFIISIYGLIISNNKIIKEK